jgi:hypothetical protein
LRDFTHSLAFPSRKRRTRATIALITAGLGIFEIKSNYFKIRVRTRLRAPKDFDKRLVEILQDSKVIGKIIISHSDGLHVHPFIAHNLAPGTTAKTDGWSAYPGAPSVKHDPPVVGKMAAHIVLPWVHRIFSNLKVWALGVYHGLRRKYLQSYLDEFVFRFNRRRTRHAAFRSLLGIAGGHAPISYKMLITPEAKA